MSDRPRVTASAEGGGITTRTVSGEFTHTTPEVLVQVSFDLHDHAAALACLDRAVASVRAQIEETNR